MRTTPRHHVREDLTLGFHHALMERLLELVELSRAGLARHRMIFEELPNGVEHSIVKFASGFARRKAASDFVADGLRVGGVGHARSTRRIAAKFRAPTRQDQINTES